MEASSPVVGSSRYKTDTNLCRSVITAFAVEASSPMVGSSGYKTDTNLCSRVITAFAVEASSPVVGSSRYKTGRRNNKFHSYISSLPLSS